MARSQAPEHHVKFPLNNCAAGQGNLLAAFLFFGEKGEELTAEAAEIHRGSAGGRGLQRSHFKERSAPRLEKGEKLTTEATEVRKGNGGRTSVDRFDNQET
jgi:hypothetical protein